MTDEELKRAAGFQSDPKWAAELLGLPVIRGAKFVCILPDWGPWDATVFCGRQFWTSQASGLYELIDDKLVKIEPMFEPKESSMSHMEEVERRSAALYKAPRVSLDDIKANIACRYDLNAGDVVRAVGAPEHDSVRLLSICLLVTQNGFTVIGKSAPASPENFDREYGKQLAYEDAVKQLWPLMGYALREKLRETSAEG